MHVHRTGSGNPALRCLPVLVGLLLGCAGPNAIHLRPYREMVEARPADIEAHYEYGSAAYALGEWEIARNEFEQVLVEQPEDVLVRLKLAQVQLQMGDVFQARDTYQFILDEDSENREARILKGDTDMGLIRAFEQAGTLWFFGRSGEMNLFQRRLLEDWGISYDELLDIYQEARDTWQWLVKKEPMNAEAWCKLGVVHNLTGKIQGAKAAFRLASIYNKRVISVSPFYESVCRATDSGVRWSPLIAVYSPQ